MKGWHRDSDGYIVNNFRMREQDKGKGGRGKDNGTVSRKAEKAAKRRAFKSMFTEFSDGATR